MKRTGFIIFIACFAALLGYWIEENNRSHYNSSKAQTEQSQQSSRSDANQSTSHASQNSALYAAYLNKQSYVQVTGDGVVKAVLKDDETGSRHQKFILDLHNGMTVLVAHNIDLAPRLEGLNKGDQIVFSGEYEYNDKGGVVHWTHKDPSQRHADGWLKWNGKMYQ
ncbi:DUF3465 domain-containing protein [Acinetobacter sp. MD2(2019)]|uniref:DUF3465 domain-containing protein n=1 Tax=Acinetobacter sp. MD2(2019) TaxID=2605273 RepID=UPI002D1E52D2|nr:DUF3465 domain-containing protein [Acinetobacter sp. MD2(2019)]MEB3754077.1 DUF3465 domain-containing protein [Acinetobacter sp. MD2(2019)]